MLRVIHRDGADSELVAPGVGIFTPTAVEGEVVSPGQVVGAIEVLGTEHPLRAPEGVAGQVTWRAGSGRTRVPIQYGDAVFRVSRGAEVRVAESPQARETGAASLVFAAPMSGRFYGRPSPNEAAFINAGDTIVRGQTIGLLEVMKTFNRLVYQGDALPKSAVVDAIVPADGDDVVRDDVILTLKPNAET